MHCGSWHTKSGGGDGGCGGSCRTAHGSSRYSVLCNRLTINFKSSPRCPFSEISENHFMGGFRYFLLLFVFGHIESRELIQIGKLMDAME